VRIALQVHQSVNERDAVIALQECEVIPCGTATEAVEEG
jgi:hypothetical protein